MKHFGIVQSFDEATGHGSIRPENGGTDLGFQRSGMAWDRMVPARAGVRLSYQLAVRNGKASAVDLHPAPARRASPRKSFTVFRSAAEEAETKARQDLLEDERRHLSAAAARVVRTTIEHTFINDWRHVGLPAFFTALVVGAAFMVAFLIP